MGWPAPLFPRRGTDVAAAFQKPSLLPLAVVWLTAALITGLAYFWGPPMPYRLGESYPFDLRVRTDFEVVNPVALANRVDNGGNKAGNEPVVEKYPAGMLLIQRGQPVTRRQLELVREEHEAYLALNVTRWNWSAGLLPLFVIFSHCSQALWHFTWRLFSPRWHIACQPSSGCAAWRF